MNSQLGQMVYKAGTGDNQVVITGKCILHRIIVGTDVASSVIEVSDDAADGDVNLKIKLSSSTLKGVYEINAFFEKGICVDQTNQTQVTYVVSPVN